MLYLAQVLHNMLCSLEWVEMQRWSGGMQCMVAIMVVYVYCGCEGWDGV